MNTTTRVAELNGLPPDFTNLADRIYDLTGWPTHWRAIAEAMLYDIEGFVQSVGEHHHHSTGKEHACGPTDGWTWPCPDIDWWRHRLDNATI